MVKRLLLAVTFAAVAGGSWWWFAARPVAVSVAPLVRGDAVEVVYATGAVEPQRWAEVTPVIRARIIETCRCEGQEVPANTVLFKLDDSEVGARLSELQARMQFAQKEFLRAEGLLDRRVGTREKYDEAFANLSQIRASVAAVESQLAQFEIKAPMAGQVLRIDGEIGEVAELGQALAWIGQPRPLRIVAEVNEEDIPLVRVDQEALIAADAFPDRNLPATVASITPKGDPVLKTYRVYLSLPDDTPLFIGMSVDVNIVISVHGDVVLAPAPSLIRGAVQIVGDDGRVEIRPVEIGIVGTDRVEIVSGAHDGETVVSPALDGLASGDRVKAE